MGLTTTYRPKLDRVRAGVGSSTDPDGVRAGHEAARAAMASLKGHPADLVLVVASVRYDLQAMLRAINAVTENAPLVGATSSGHMHRGELTEPGEGLAVLALAGGGYEFGIGRADGARTQARSAGRDLTRAALAAVGERQEYETLLVLSDGLAGDQQELINGIHQVAGFAVPVIGGLAGDDRRLEQTFVFEGDDVLTDAAVAVWIGSPRPLRVVCQHGWHPTGLPLMVTSVDGQMVREIGGRPAIEVYRDHFVHDNPDDQIETGREGGYHSAHAFGLIQPDGSLLIRGAFQDDNGSLFTFTPLPLYSAVQVMSSGVDDLLAVGVDTVATAVAEKDAGVVLVFDCVARLDILAEHGRAEAAALQAAAGTIPTFGFYTYGEFARTTGVAGYHNATIAAIAL